MADKKQTLAQELTELLAGIGKSETISKYREKIRQGRLTRDEDPESHFCVYFAPYDPEAKQVFFGHHKKAGLWLFNGGHIDAGETVRETLEREIGEEWGLEASGFRIWEPALFTITEIDNPGKQACRRHHDIWFFIPVKKDEFRPASDKLAVEYHETGWKGIPEALAIAQDPSTREAIGFIEKELMD